MLLWIVRLAIETGMRRGEVVRLRCPQVDLERRIVRVLESKNGDVRTVPLSQEATRVLGEALAHPIRPRDTDLIFWGDARDTKTGACKPYDFIEAWEGARRRAGLDDLRFHDLRHEAGSRFVEAGLSDQEVAAISGHRGMQMLRRYTHLRLFRADYKHEVGDTVAAAGNFAFNTRQSAAVQLSQKMIGAKQFKVD